MSEKSRFQILVDNLDHEAKEQIVRILEANVDKSLRPLPRAPEGAPIARLAENFISGRTDSRTAMDNLLVIGGKFFVKPKSDRVVKPSNPLFAALAKEEEKAYLIRKLSSIVPIAENFDDIRIEEGEIVFYLDGEWQRKAEFDNAEALQIVMENDLDVADFLVSVCPSWINSDNKLTAISDSDKIAQFFSQNGVEVHVRGEAHKGVEALQEDARPRRESVPIKDFGKLEFDGRVLTRNGGVQIIGENWKDTIILNGMVELLKKGVLRLSALIYPFRFISSPVRRSEGVFIEFTQDAEVWLEAQKTKV